MSTSLANVPLNAGRRRVFNSVFSPASLQARSPFSPSENENLNASFQSTGSSSTVRNDSFAVIHPDGVADSDRDWDRAWTAATAFLAVPDLGFAPVYEGKDTDGSDAIQAFGRLSPPSRETADALTYLVSAAPQAADESKNLISWYGDEIRRHFLLNLRGGLHQLLKHPEQAGLLRDMVKCLQLARRIYLTPVIHELMPRLRASTQGVVLTQLQRTFHAVVSYSLPWSQISTLLAGELAQSAIVILGIDTLLEDSSSDEDSENDMQIDRHYSVSYDDWRQQSPEDQAHMMLDSEGSHVTIARDQLLAFMNGLEVVGLGGDKAQKVFASVMNIMMTEFVRAAYTDRWEAPTSALAHLRHWVDNVFCRLVVQVLATIHTPTTDNRVPSTADVSSGDIEKWQEISVARLGALRTSELFDVIVEWPASAGAIEDLRQFITHPAARAYVTQSFIASLNQRLLHPGASTVEILQLYISIIRGFHILDPKGVLLDRIARPIRRYLRERDDTVKVIVSGLLAEAPVTAATEATLPSSTDTLIELSTELARAHKLSLEHKDSELDWDDANWMPDPVDAAPDYRKSKSADVIDSLVSLFDSKETFVKELQTLLADRLLQKREHYDQEVSVLELLKVRFGDSALQACEVMLRDIYDSRRVDGVLHAKILSRFFWPEIQDQEFKIPDEIQSIQDRYSAGFEAIKQSRKLTWRNGLGQVTVELELEDRSFLEEVTTWQATVIHAFQSSDESTTKTVEDLTEELEMAAPLVRSACLFWVSKRILAEIKRDCFRVLETLPSEDEQHVAGPGSAEDENSVDDAANAAAAAEAAAAAAAKETAEAAAMEKMNLYWQFIVGMLTNQGAMPLQRIVMMLKIVVPGGFPFSNEELREFLAGMVTRGKLEIVSGGSYKLVH
ncbi:hypothetical protein N7468_010595 [Penicillium chermesinum]|uniref:Anaphase-promoting complex subunit 2 n=1 Tax=Penicillium chermesinum TaxID=63820 RepID=A0A9W9N7Z9_9EURO|nr:uncharacterized protein N7468_010595 [Penicillium chermesinum]KAJ5214916.1 hypothetical protein N7468_010595 [Penicillium chermesinum]